MSEFVKKTIMGYKEVPGGHSDPECEYVILTKREYDQLLRAIREAEQATGIAVSDAKMKEKRLLNDMERKIRNTEHNAQKEIAAIMQELDEERKKSDYHRGLNENLLRIAKERANADRNLRPKKEHTGYVVVSSTEKDWRYRDNRNKWETTRLWETVLQSPYSLDFNEQQARHEMGELTGEDSDDWVAGRLGITDYYDGEYSDMLYDEDCDWAEDPEKNVMLRWRLRANARTGYWEVLFLHTKPLDVIPRDMRAC